MKKIAFAQDTSGPVILVTNDACVDRLSSFIQATAPNVELIILTGRKGVIETLQDRVTPDTLLVCFSTGVIIPKAVLSCLKGPAYNFHAASPEYPGRDPHHFAVYYNAKRYGATAHEVAIKVDSGRIIGVEWFEVAPSTPPQALREAAVEAAFILYCSLMPRILRREHIPSTGIEWREHTWTRKEFLKMCKISPTIGREEYERRYFAFNGGEYNNLTIEVHGHLFSIDKRSRK